MVSRPAAGEFAPPDDTSEFPTLSRVVLTFGAATHPGKVRPSNEDQFLVARLSKSLTVCSSSLPDSGYRLQSTDAGYLFVVADGMGGVAGGEHASALAVATVEDFALNTLKWFLGLGGSGGQTLVNELREAIERADRVVLERARDDPRLHGMGTTLTMAYTIGNDLFLAHAGDSRAYLYHGGEIEQVTTDHTLVQMLVDNGAIRPEEARHHRRRHVVTNVIGGPGEGVQVEIHKLRVQDGDVLLLCSDGLSEMLDDAAIAETLASYDPPEAIADRLVAQALDRGGVDNVTTIVVRFAADMYAATGQA